MSPCQHFDVVIVGAGISGVGAAYYLGKECPELDFQILEEHESFGGTWLTHRYPGIRSDSDLHTYGYRFKPWTGPLIATADEIRAYMEAVIDENGLAPRIRYRHKITSAEWSSDAARWKLSGRQTDTGEPFECTAAFLWMCAGYYRHQQGYTPKWLGLYAFKGQIVHPQSWPAALDYTGKNIIVIGSGATAATLIPAMAEKCGHITMLQRSPTYFWAGKYDISIADELRKWQVGEDLIHEIVRKKIIHDQSGFVRQALTDPEQTKKDLIAAAREYLGPNYDVETHFAPKYEPWRQRLAYIPNGDLFRAIASGKVSVVTDDIDRFTETGLVLTSGKSLAADLIVTATGFNMNVFGDITISIDDRQCNVADCITYRGLMFTGLPNFACVFGYFRNSWTLRLDLVADFVCRLLKHMKARGAHSIVPVLGPEDLDAPLSPYIDSDDFGPGYLKRAIHLLPKRLGKKEWQQSQDYWTEKDEIPAIDLDDPIFHYA